MSPRHRSKDRRYLINYAASAVDHLKHLRAGERTMAMDSVDERLSFEPTVETRNCKRMEKNPLKAEFELRTGPLRVYYGVDEDTRAVNVLAVGIKKRNRVIIGGEEIEL